MTTGPSREQIRSGGCLAARRTRRGAGPSPTPAISSSRSATHASGRSASPVATVPRSNRDGIRGDRARRSAATAPGLTARRDRLVGPQDRLGSGRPPSRRDPDEQAVDDDQRGDPAGHRTGPERRLVADARVRDDHLADTSLGGSQSRQEAAQLGNDVARRWDRGLLVGAGGLARGAIAPATRHAGATAPPAPRFTRHGASLRSVGPADQYDLIAAASSRCSTRSGCAAWIAAATVGPWQDVADAVR